MLSLPTVEGFRNQGGLFVEMSWAEDQMRWTAKEVCAMYTPRKCKFVNLSEFAS